MGVLDDALAEIPSAPTKRSPLDEALAEIPDSGASSPLSAALAEIPDVAPPTSRLRRSASAVADAALAVPRKMAEGYREVTAPPKPGESYVDSALRGLSGGAKMLWPVGSIAGDVVEPAFEALGEKGREIQQRQPPPATGYSPWEGISAKRWGAKDDAPTPPPVPVVDPKAVAAGGRMLTEGLVGLVPGYTMTARGAAGLARMRRGAPIPEPAVSSVTPPPEVPVAASLPPGGECGARGRP